MKTNFLWRFYFISAIISLTALGSCGGDTAQRSSAGSEVKHAGCGPWEGNVPRTVAKSVCYSGTALYKRHHKNLAAGCPISHYEFMRCCRISSCWL